MSTPTDQSSSKSKLTTIHNSNSLTSSISSSAVYFSSKGTIQDNFEVKTVFNDGSTFFVLKLQQATDERWNKIITLFYESGFDKIIKQTQNSLSFKIQSPSTLKYFLQQLQNANSIQQKILKGLRVFLLADLSDKVADLFTDCVNNIDKEF